MSSQDFRYEIFDVMCLLGILLLTTTVMIIGFAITCVPGDYFYLKNFTSEKAIIMLVSAFALVIASCIVRITMNFVRIDNGKKTQKEDSKKIEKERAFPDMPWSAENSPDKPASEWAKLVSSPELSEYLIKRYGDKYMTGSQFDAVLKGYYQEEVSQN